MGLEMDMEIALPAPPGRALAVQTLPEPAQAVERLPALRRRLRHVTLPQLAGRALHPLDGVAQGPVDSLSLLALRIFRSARRRQRAPQVLGPPPDLLCSRASRSSRRPRSPASSAGSLASACCCRFSAACRSARARSRRRTSSSARTSSASPGDDRCS